MGFLEFRMSSWSARLGVKQNIPHQTQQLKIKHPFHPRKQPNSVTAKSNIPDYVRYAKEPNSDDDIIIFSTSNPTKYKRFIFNDFNGSEQMFVFKLTLSYLEQDDCIDFFKFCQKYGKILKNDAELLYFWKFICLRESDIQQLQKEPSYSINKINDYKDWKSRYENWRKQQVTIKYNPKYGHLTFYKEDRWFYVYKRTMIIVSKHECHYPYHHPLDPEYLATSNWYDVEDDDPEMKVYVNCRTRGQFRTLRQSVRNPGESVADYIFSKGVIVQDYMHPRYWFPKYRFARRGGGCTGVMNLDVDLMMENLFISKRGVKRYHIYSISYEKCEAYCMEIFPLDGTKGDNDKKRRCKLVNSDDGEFEGCVLQDIVSANELKSRMDTKQSTGHKLKIVYYKMYFGYRYNGLQPCVVVDYH